MKKILLASLAITAGAALQVHAAWPVTANISDPTVSPSATKLGQLDISLKHQFQAYEKPKGSVKWGIMIDPTLAANPLVGRPANRKWLNFSYAYLDSDGNGLDSFLAVPGIAPCPRKVSYLSDSKQINNTLILNALNAALRAPVVKDAVGATVTAAGLFLQPGTVADPNPYYGGKFNTGSATKLVVVNYENLDKLPPYPPTIDMFYGLNPTTLPQAPFNAPYDVDFTPNTAPAAPDGTLITLAWPNLNYISWGKPDQDSATFAWKGARVFVIDPKNVNENLRCFDVTPFFALEESYCAFCWDTTDRVTDGSITRTTDQGNDPPCATGTADSCGIKGSATTRLYWTVKFNNVASIWAADPNLLAWRYYAIACNFQANAWGGTVGGAPVGYGVKLDDTDFIGSQNALVFAASGVSTYGTPWKYQKLSDGFNWPMGKWSMGSAQGHALSPMCGVVTGSISITETDRSARQYGGAFCLD
jgi:hypothetical protein